MPSPHFYNIKACAWYIRITGVFPQAGIGKRSDNFFQCWGGAEFYAAFVSEFRRHLTEAQKDPAPPAPDPYYGTVFNVVYCAAFIFSAVREADHPLLLLLLLFHGHAVFMVPLCLAVRYAMLHSFYRPNGVLPVSFFLFCLEI